tara:strand:- start:21 stop:797 length:777 start_codon:yes stop_codon:yes gene_type:complete
MIKILLILLILISIPVANAIPLSDMTGLRFTFPIKSDDRSFTIEATANFQITNLDFNKNEKTITLDVISSIENNIMEIVVPKSLISGDFRFYLDDIELFPKLNPGKNVLLIKIEFTGVGNHQIKLQGTTYLDIFDVSEKINYEISNAVIAKIESNPSTNSLIFSLTDTNKDPGKLSIKLSDDVILPFDNNEFIVIVDGIDSDYSIVDDMLNIKFNSDSKKITIMGTYVIPEFHEIAPIVLTTSFIGLIVLRKYKKLFI